MNYEITPEPDERERAAILEALAAEKAEETDESAESPWAETLLPRRDGDEEREP